MPLNVTRFFYTIKAFRPTIIGYNYKRYITNAQTLLFPQTNSFEDQLLAALEEFKASKLDKHVANMEVNKTIEKMKNEKWNELRKHKKQRRNWVDYKANDDNDDDDEATKAKRQQMEPGERVKRRKCAIMLSYCGANYIGMQRNPGMDTIEEFLLKAMLKNEWIKKEHFEFPQDLQFQRAARTDKGVSAARQVCSVKLPDDLDLVALNKDLPEDIRLFAVKRVTKGFNSKDQCDARTYTYTMPTIGFADLSETPDFESYRIDAKRLEHINQLLKYYEGTKNYHNFTSKKHFIDPSVKRYMKSFTCSVPFLSPQNIEFVTLKVKGQSFMMHQIRKMVGLIIAIVRGHTTPATLDLAFTEHKVDLPRAPGLGLVLDTVHYERYNNRYGNDGIHEPLTWEQQEAEVLAFKEKHINSIIYKTEYEQRPMIEWLETLHRHTYDVRTGTEHEVEDSEREVEDNEREVKDNEREVEDNEKGVEDNEKGVEDDEAAQTKDNKHKNMENIVQMAELKTTEKTDILITDKIVNETLSPTNS